MASSHSLSPPSEDGINPTAFTTPSDGRSRNNSLEYVPILNTTILSGSATKVASSIHRYLPRISVPGFSAIRGVASSDYHDHIDENDVVIAVMGPTGVGKSSFVNKAAGKAEVVIGYDLKSQTRTVQPVRCPHPDGRRNIVLVDTPGFDDTHLSDVHVLKIIATWLGETYKSNIKLSGILYLHRISDVRLAGTPLKNLAVFKDLCGDDNLKNVVLVTTMWDEVNESTGSKREKELLSDFWKVMIHLGSRTCRFQGTRDSAWEIIGRLDLVGSRRAQLQIQQEMVDRRLSFENTTAAKTLLRFLLGEMKRTWTWLRTTTRQIFGAGRSSGSLLRHALSRSSTRGPGASETGRSAGSPTNISNNPSPTGSASTSCNVNARRDTLSHTITALGLCYQVAEIATIPILRGAIGTVLQMAQLIQGMGGTHHAITQVIEYAGWLLKEIAQFVVGSELSRGMKKTLSSFTKELDHLLDVVTTISRRGHIARFFLQDSDIQAIATCTNSIRAIYDKIEVKLAMDSHQVLVSLENQLRELRNETTLRQCQCGTSVLHEESQESENEQQSTTTSQSS